MRNFSNELFGTMKGVKMGLLKKEFFPVENIKCEGPDNSCRVCAFLGERRTFKLKDHHDVYLCQTSTGSVIYFNNHDEQPDFSQPGFICLSGVKSYKEALLATVSIDLDFLLTAG